MRRVQVSSRFTPERRISVIRKLGAAYDVDDGDAAALPVLRTALRDKDFGVFHAALYALRDRGADGDDEAVSALLEAFVDPGFRGRETLARVLGSLDAAAKPQVVAALRGALEDDDDWVRMASVVALVAQRQEVGDEAIRQALNSDMKCVRIGAVYALGALGDAGLFLAQFLLVQTLAMDADPDVKEGAVRSMGYLGRVASAEVVSAVRATTRDANPFIRKAGGFALAHLGRSKNEAALVVLRAGLKDPSPWIRKISTDAFEQIRKDEEKRRKNRLSLVAGSVSDAAGAGAGAVRQAVQWIGGALGLRQDASL